jgi:hypothetical protein
MSSAYIASNNGTSTLAAAVTTSTQTTITLAAGHGARFPSPSGGDYTLITLESGTTREIVRIVGRSTDVLTVGDVGSAAANNVGRGLEGTTATTWAIGDIVSCRMTAALVTRGGNAKTAAELAAVGGAALIGNTAAGNISATTVQAAINELDTEKAKLAANTFTASQTISSGSLLGSYGTGGITTNFAAGDGALAANTTGTYNTAVGKSALAAVNTGSANTAIGGLSLQANTSGNYNTAVGKNALYSNTTASSNTAFGSFAVQSNTTGYNNTGVGSAAIQNNLTGYNLTAVGYLALQANTTGRDNVAVGVNALQNSTTYSQNVAIGTGALYQNASDNNVAVGFNTLALTTTAYTNTAVGSQALMVTTTGYTNAALGTNALTTNTTGWYNTAIGGYALQFNLSGIGNTGCGVNALGNVTSGSGNAEFGPINSAGAYATVFNVTTQSNRLCAGSTSTTNAYIQVAWTVVSDARDKTEFARVPHGLDFVSRLKPTSYRYKVSREGTEGHGPVRYGFKAQEVLELEGNNPVIVDTEDLDKLRFNDQSMIAVLVNALQELNAKFDAYVLTHP